MYKITNKEAKERIQRALDVPNRFGRLVLIDEESANMAIEALQTKVVWCKDCKYQDECEEVVLFDINDDEIMGHRIHWCSYGRSEK